MMDGAKRDKVIPLSTGSIMLSELWKKYERVHGLDRTLYGCPTNNMSDVYTLGHFGDVVYDKKYYGMTYGDKYRADVGRLGDLWRGIYFPNQDGRNVELWYIDKLIATWDRVHDLTFKDYIPLNNIVWNITVKWDGDPNVLMKYYYVKNSDRNRENGLDVINTNRVWMCELDPKLNYLVGIYNGDCYNIKKM